MSIPRPSWRGSSDDAAPEPVEVEWSQLRDGWRTLPVRLRMAGETRAEYANRVRAAIAEGLAEPALLAFADHLEELPAA